MRFLQLDDLMTSYTNARPGAGLLVVDLDLGTASGLLASALVRDPEFQDRVVAETRALLSTIPK
jgi:hypothetical protein